MQLSGNQNRESHKSSDASMAPVTQMVEPVRIAGHTKAERGVDLLIAKEVEDCYFQSS